MWREINDYYSHNEVPQFDELLDNYNLQRPAKRDLAVNKVSFKKTGKVLMSTVNNLVEIITNAAMQKDLPILYESKWSYGSKWSYRLK